MIDVNFYKIILNKIAFVFSVIKKSKINKYKRGAMKKSLYNGNLIWAHIICVNWNPSIYYENEM